MPILKKDVILIKGYLIGENSSPKVSRVIDLVQFIGRVHHQQARMAIDRGKCKEHSRASVAYWILVQFMGRVHLQNARSLLAGEKSKGFIAGHYQDKLGSF